jgi:thiamine biosynthesis lipoprotein
VRYTYLILFLVLISCTDNPATNQLRGEAFGTYYYIKTVDSDLNDVRSKIEYLIDSINQSMSTYQSNSIISKLNNQKKAKVDEMFTDVFKASKEIYKKTGGYFDPTVGLLVDHYGFGSQNTDTTISVDSLKKFIGLNLIRLKDDTLYKQYQQTRLDFNSIAKGYAVDQFALLLSDEGFKHYLIDIGGEVLAKGHKPQNKPWIVGIDQPVKSNSGDKRKLTTRLSLTDKALATSGNYRKYKLNKKTNQETVHTVNPKTGKAEPSSLLSASVMADKCITADAYATAFMAMGYKEAIKIIENDSDVEAYLIYKTEDGNELTYISEGFKSSIID